MAGRNIILGSKVPVQVNDPAILKTLVDQNVPSLHKTGGVVDYLVDPLYGAIIDIAPKPHTLGAQPWPWNVPVGTEIMIDPACLSGCGAVKTPIRLVNDGEVLAPDGEQILYNAVAPYSSYVAQITGDPTTPAVVAINLPGGNPKIPPGLLYLGCGIRVVATYKHAAGASAPYLRILFGNTNGVGTTTLIDGSVSATGNEVTFDAVARITRLGGTSTGLFLPNGRAWKNTGESIATGAFVDKGCSTDLNFYVLLAATPNNQTINIQRLQVSLVP